jgi:hypothetical protein
LQKGFRDLERELEISKFKISLRYGGKDKIKIPPELQEAIKEFTNKKGYEVSLWTPESTIQKIKIINSVHSERASNHLTISLFFIYRHASEIAHGTLFGIYFTTGNLPFEKPIKNREEMKNYQRGKLCALLQSISLALDSLLIILSKHANISEIVKQSHENLKEYSDIMKIDFDEKIDDFEAYLKKQFAMKK